MKPDQKNAIEKIIFAKYRKEQIKLWKAFVEGILDKEYLFLKVFQQKYLEKKDYLLRNELRLIKTIIDKFLIAEQKDILYSNFPNQQNYLYLLGLQKLGEINLMKKVLPTFIAQCMENNDYHFAQLMTLHFIQILELEPPKQSNLMEINGLLEERQTYLNNAFLENSLLNNYIFEYTKHKSQEGNYPEKIASFPHSILNNLSETETPILKYFKLMGQIKKMKGAEKIEALKSALQIIKSISTKKIKNINLNTLNASVH